MVSALVLCLGLLAAQSPAAALSAADRKAYQEARVEAGRDADAHVRLAIWCGEHGMEAERLKHLGIAVVIDPRHARARALLGMANPKDDRPEDVPPPPPAPDPDPALPADPASPAGAPPPTDPAVLADYNARRANTPDTAEAQWQLALWCEQKGLRAEATVHLANVVRLDPAREAAWKHLGFKKYNGRWSSDEQIAAEKLAVEAQKKADRHWKPLLEKWKSWLAIPAKRDEAEKALAALADPWAVASIWRVFGTAGVSADQIRAVQLLGQLRHASASRMLAFLAIAGKTDDVRRAALEVLTQRDPMEFVDLWVGLLRKPLAYEVRPVGRPGSAGAIYVEGERFNVERLYASPSFNDTLNLYGGSGVYHFRMPLNFGSQSGPPPGSIQVGTAPDGTALYWHDQFLNPRGGFPSVRSTPDPRLAYQVFEAQVVQQVILLDWLLSETQKMSYGAALRQQKDVETIEAYNASVRQTNTRASEALAGVTGQNLGDDRAAWLKWWNDQRGYAYSPAEAPPKITLLLHVPLPYMPSFGPPIIVPRLGAGPGGAGPGWCLVYDHGRDPVRRSEWWASGTCFGAGTPVLTPDGPRTIESLRPGDRVLGADGITVEQVAAVARNSSSPTLRLMLADEILVTTSGHPFALQGGGWVRAADLRPGDDVRALETALAVEDVQPGPAQPVYNLRLAGGHAFLIGEGRVVVHDGSLIPAQGAQVAGLRERP
jgi:hypothetical protein